MGFPGIPQDSVTGISNGPDVLGSLYQRISKGLNSFLGLSSGTVLIIPSLYSYYLESAIFSKISSGPSVSVSFSKCLAP